MNLGLAVLLYSVLPPTKSRTLHACWLWLCDVRSMWVFPSFASTLWTPCFGPIRAPISSFCWTWAIKFFKSLINSLSTRAISCGLHGFACMRGTAECKLIFLFLWNESRRSDHSIFAQANFSGFIYVQGGGLFVDRDSAVTMTLCTLSNNSAVSEFTLAKCTGSLINIMLLFIFFVRERNSRLGFTLAMLKCRAEERQFIALLACLCIERLTSLPHEHNSRSVYMPCRRMWVICWTHITLVSIIIMHTWSDEPSWTLGLRCFLRSLTTGWRVLFRWRSHSHHDCLHGVKQQCCKRANMPSTIEQNIFVFFFFCT